MCALRSHLRAQHRIAALALARISAAPTHPPSQPFFFVHQAEIAYQKLETPLRERWLALDDSVTVSGKTPGGVLRTNAFDDDTGHANLYELLSRVNHSCEPNAIRESEQATRAARQPLAHMRARCTCPRDDPREHPCTPSVLSSLLGSLLCRDLFVVGISTLLGSLLCWDLSFVGQGSGVRLRASRVIEQGDEILVNYMDGIDADLAVEQRRQRLKQQYSFHCECPRCVREAP